MKTVRDACQLQPNALAIKLSDQIEQLDELITAEGDGSVFFEKTYITQGMRDLIAEGIARLAGASSLAVFHLKQAMGSGKTHLLVGFGLLAKHAPLRATYCAGMAHTGSFHGAAIAAFNGRNNPDHFFWGKIANQLGKGAQSQRELLADLADYLAKRLDALRPDEASAVRVLRELVKNQRLG